MKSLLALFGLACTFSAVLVPVTRLLFICMGKLDQPDTRKLHQTPVPRSGGLALVLAYLIAIAVFMLLPAGGNFVFDRYGGFMIRLLPATAAIFMTGFFDDWLDLPPRLKLAGQVAAASLAYWAGIKLFDFGLELEPLSFLLTVLWLVLCSNAFNLTDGTDGLAGTLAMLSCISIIVAALALDYYSLALVFVPLLGAIIPFLRANWPPATLFLGDTGSLTLGFLIACGGAALSRRFPSGEGFTAAVLILMLPLVEVALSSTRRMIRGNPLFTADCFHIHHQLKRQGHNDSQVLNRLSFLSLLGTILAVLQIWLSPPERVLLIASYLLFIGVSISRLRYMEFYVLGEALVRGRIVNSLRHQILLREMEQILADAKDPESCIKVIHEVAGRLGLQELNIRLEGITFEQRRPLSHIKSTYMVRIDLLNQNWVNFRVPVDLKRAENPAGDFAAVLMRVFNSQRLAQHQQGEPLQPRQPEVTLA